jgi:chemotaxis protein MotB
MHDGFDSAHVVPAGAKALDEVKTELQQVLRDEVKGGTVRISEDGRGLTVSLSEAGFFDPGSAVMKPKALEILDRIAEKRNRTHGRVAGIVSFETETG